MPFSRVWILGVFFLCGQLVPAQTISARLDLSKRDPKPEFYEYVSADQGVVTFGPMSRVSTRFLGIHKYNANLKEQWEKSVIEQNGRKNIDFMSVIGENILVFVSEFFPKEKVIKTYYYRYDLEGNTLAEEELMSVYPNQPEQKVELQYVLSPNKRKLLAYKNLENKREAERIKYYLFDYQGDFVQNGELTLRYPDNRFRIRSIRVSNAGDIFVLGKFDPNNWINDRDFKYLIYRQDLDTEQTEEFLIDFGDRFISDLTFRVDRDGNMLVAGFYSNRGEDQLAGITFQQINPLGEVIRQNSQPFSEEFLRYFLSKGQINRGRELSDFYIRPEDGIILRSDGGVLLLAEKIYKTYITYRDQFNYPVDREVFHFDDVILISINGRGEIDWQAIVDKAQQSETPQNLSFFNAIGPEGTYIFYEYKPRRAGINIYYNLVGFDGQVDNRKPLLRAFDYGDEFYPRFCQQISNDEAIMVYTQKGGRILSVVRVSLAE